MKGVHYNSTFVYLNLWYLTHEHVPRDSEIAELMSVKSKHGAGGEYSPEWQPKVCFSLRMTALYWRCDDLWPIGRRASPGSWPTASSPRRASIGSTWMACGTQAGGAQGEGDDEAGTAATAACASCLAGACPP